MKGKLYALGPATVQRRLHNVGDTDGHQYFCDITQFLTEDELAEVSRGCTYGSQGDAVIRPIYRRSELLCL
jgi:hypothetical protein